MIYINDLKPAEIPFLQNKQTLYTCDFRAISESMDYKIPSMWKYENLLPWILNHEKVVVNEERSLLQYPNRNELIIAPRSKDPRVSVFRRLPQDSSFNGISKIWVAIPHPEADTLAKEKRVDISYSFNDFLKRNNKIRQKKLLQQMTPKWKLLQSRHDFEKAAANSMPGYIKRAHGSGGYAIFLNHDINNNDNLHQLIAQSGEWFFEEMVEGKPHSIQAVRFKKTGKIIIFGFAAQTIAQSKHFTGARILSISLLNDNIFKQLQKAIAQLTLLLKNYEGFFGIDFILDKNDTVHILEANIRMTALTVPTLLKNLAGGNEAIYEEDLEINETGESNIILGYENVSGTGDILTFFPVSDSLGKSITFNLRKCEAIPKKLDEATIQELCSILSESVSKQAGYTVKNFWPFGWTICFILEESHCILSGWYLEKRIMVDLFVCGTKVNSSAFQSKLVKLFQSRSPGLLIENIRK